MKWGDEKIAAAKVAENYKLLVKHTYEKQKYGELYREIEWEEQLNPIRKPLHTLIDAVNLSPALNAKVEPLKPAILPNAVDIEHPPKIPESPVKKLPLGEDKRKKMGYIVTKYLAKIATDKKFKVNKTLGVTPVFDKDSLDIENYIGNHLAFVRDNNISLNEGKTWFEGTEEL